MGTIKTNWTDPIMPSHESLSGEGFVTQSGSDPWIDTGGTGGLQGTLWSNPLVPTPGGEETSNSVSGLPPLPTRFAPSETPPPIPDLTQRNPGTIDKQ